MNVVGDSFTSSSCFSFSLSGTTWMQEIVTLILKRGDPHLSQTVPNWARAPWLEQHHFAAFLKTSPITPRLITTHLPYHLLGPALQGSKTKVRLQAETVGQRVVRGRQRHRVAAQKEKVQEVI